MMENKLDERVCTEGVCTEELKYVNSEIIENMPMEIFSVLKGKGLSLSQAEAMLDYTKILMHKFIRV